MRLWLTQLFLVFIHASADRIETLKTSGGPLKARLSGASHLTFEAPADLAEYLELAVHVKPSKSDGLIFFAGDSRSHVALFLRDGHVLFQFDLGRGPSLVRSEKRLVMDAWAKVEAWRTGKGSLMKVSRQGWVEGLAPAGSDFMDGVDLSRVVLGGPGELPALPPNLHQIGGFHGCVDRLVVNEVNMDMRRPVSSARVGDCHGDVCSPSPCGRGHQCAAVASEAVCLCRFPFAGLHCDEALRYFHGPIAFSRHSYLSFTQKEALRRLTSKRLDLRLKFRFEDASKGLDQTLLYAGGETVDGDGLRLSLNANSQVRLELQLGSGSLELSHQLRLSSDTWHSVALHRHGKKVTLIVDEVEPTTAHVPGPSQALGVRGGFSLGGQPQGPRAKFIGLHGCVEELVLGRTLRISNVEQADEAYNVKPCAQDKRDNETF